MTSLLSSSSAHFATDFRLCLLLPISFFCCFTFSSTVYNVAKLLSFPRYAILGSNLFIYIVMVLTGCIPGRKFFTVALLERTAYTDFAKITVAKRTAKRSEWVALKAGKLCDSLGCPWLRGLFSVTSPVNNLTHFRTPSTSNCPETPQVLY